jgi:hypothetical protein
MGDQADLSRLADIVVPAAIAWWPPAPGWWILGAALVAAIAILTGNAIRRYRHNAYRRAALAELSAIGAHEGSADAAAISAVLKRAALVAYPRIEVASLTGSAWLAFLDRSAGINVFSKLSFDASGGKGAGILAAAQRWIRYHRAEA